MKNQDIQVSVCIVTYNQEKYIAECLDSLVNQKTNFNFEIIVGEDCSTDGTRAIVQKYVDQYPELIVPLFHEKNVGPVENLKQVYLKANGKYIAHMDGDDLALPNKLQKQFDVLEENLDCNICSHDVIRVSNLSINQNRDWTYSGGVYDLLDLYKKLPFFAHSSKMFRNKYEVSFWNDLLINNEILDIDIHVANALDGNIFHIDQLLGGYRINTGVSFEAKVNPALPRGVKRIYDNALIIFKDDPEKLLIINKRYAYVLLQYAYNYAVFDQDPELFKEYVNLSLNKKNIGIPQVLFKIATYMPNTFFVLVRLRSKLKYGLH